MFDLSELLGLCNLNLREVVQDVASADGILLYCLLSDQKDLVRDFINRVWLLSDLRWLRYQCLLDHGEVFERVKQFNFCKYCVLSHLHQLWSSPLNAVWLD